MSSTDPVELQRKLIAPWKGRPLDAYGLLRVLNENGTRPPFFWIFNTSHEPERLAQFLGEDQPLYFSRSTHLLVRPEDDADDLRRALADYLLEQIAAHVPGGHLDIGSSCQGTGIAMNLCARLPDCGIEVGTLCLINCALPEEVTGRPALLIYGDQDPGHDPFRKDHETAEHRARAAFSAHQRVMVKARHGGFYFDEVLGEIIPQFANFRRQHAPALSALQ